jgi:hypothetical protein
MTTQEFIDRFPIARPRVQVGRWGLWLFDERWRLPYRWFEWRRYDTGFGVMLLGLAVMVVGNLRKPTR